MSCYRYEDINISDNPILKNVDLAIILAMENSNRFKHDPFILNLSKKTVIQYNKGYKKCSKCGITKTNEDIMHAYHTAFNYCKSYNNVIFFEEDAEVLNYNKRHYKIVDDYITNKFKIFSFASFGMDGFIEIDKNFYKCINTAYCQAHIISNTYRNFLINKIESKKFKGHIDSSILANDVVVYKQPLIVQLLTETENSKMWDTNLELSRYFINLLKLDCKKSNWEILYTFSKLRGMVTVKSCLVSFIVFVIILRIFK